MTISPEDLAAIDAAVRSVADRLQPEDRFDLRQEITLKVLEHRLEDEEQALFGFARRWAIDFIRREARYRQLLAELEQSASVPGRRSPLDWKPTWYPPHPEASESNPFACKGARVMTVGKGSR